MTPQARQAFSKVVDMNDIGDEIEEKQAEKEKVHADNAARLAALQTRITTATIEIAPTETGT